MLSFATPLGTHDHRTIVSVILSSGPQWGRVRFDQNAGASRRHRIQNAVLDGEICCLQSTGRSDFYRLLFRREHPYFYAFDMLSVNGEDICGLPLIERKRRLRRIMPKVDTRLLYLDSIAERGRGSVSGCGRGSG